MIEVRLQMKTGCFLFGTATAIAVTVAAAAVAGFRRNQIRDKATNIKGYLDLIPDLTEEQRAKVQEIRKVFLPKVAELRQNMRSKRAELAEELFKAPADRLKIHALTDQILQFQAELEREVIEHILQEMEILSDSQRKKFYEIIVGRFASGGVGVHNLQQGRR
jgi:Spy/CpxP family protein refolding chaperone